MPKKTAIEFGEIIDDFTALAEKLAQYADQEGLGEEDGQVWTREEIEAMSLAELRKLGTELEVGSNKKADIVAYLLENHLADGDDEDEEDDDDEDEDEEDEDEEEEYSEEDLKALSLAELKKLAKEFEVPVPRGAKSKDLIEAILEAQEEGEEDDEEDDEDDEDDEEGLTVDDLKKMSIGDLKEVAKENGVKIPRSKAGDKKAIIGLLVEAG